MDLISSISLFIKLCVGAFFKIVYPAISQDDVRLLCDTVALS